MKKPFAISLLFVLVLLQFSARGQFFAIPDANFRAYLLAQYPSVLNGSQQLILANAKVLNSSISCTNLGITNLSGIEYFYKVTMINCSGNPITSIPPLDSLTALTHLWAIGCQLNQVPPLNHLTTLQTLDLKNNQLSALPSLTGLVNLQYFDCSGNQLTTLPDLSSLTSLQKLFCFSNQLTQLPSLASLVNLEVLDCPGNQLTAIPSLSSNTALTALRCSHNQLSALPSLSSLTTIQELLVHYNQLTVLPDISANHQLTLVNLSNNKLTVLPDFSSYTALTNVKLQNNQLSFEDLLPQIDHSQFSTVFEFIPQDTLLNYPSVLLSRDAPGIVSSGIDAGVLSNQYVWYKNGITLSSAIASVTLDPPMPKDSGFYLCKVKNTTSALAGLELVVKSAKVSIGGCIGSSPYTYSITSNNCMKGAFISFDEGVIVSAYKPFSITLARPFNCQRPINFHNPYSNR